MIFIMFRDIWLWATILDFDYVNWFKQDLDWINLMNYDIFDVKYGCVMLFDLFEFNYKGLDCLLYTSPSPRD